jgi:hypothetical protein
VAVAPFSIFRSSNLVHSYQRIRPYKMVFSFIFVQLIRDRCHPHVVDLILLIFISNWVLNLGLWKEYLFVYELSARAAHEWLVHESVDQRVVVSEFLDLFNHVHRLIPLAPIFIHSFKNQFGVLNPWEEVENTAHRKRRFHLRSFHFGPYLNLIFNRLLAFPFTVFLIIYQW